MPTGQGHAPSETIAWLDTLPSRERLITLHAITIAFPMLPRRSEWKARTAAAPIAGAPSTKSGPS
jgi:hypothetical protein